MLEKILPFLKDTEIIEVIEKSIKNIVKDNYNKFKPQILEYTKTKSNKIKEKIINFVMDNASLPWYMKPFKKTIKKTLDKNFDKLEKLLLEKIG